MFTALIFASSVFSDVVYSVGGVIDGDPDHSDSMESFNLSSNQSTLMPSMSIRRVACSGATLNGSFYVCGNQLLQQSLFIADSACSIGVGAGTFLGVKGYFAQICPKTFYATNFSFANFLWASYC